MKITSITNQFATRKLRNFILVLANAFVIGQASASTPILTNGTWYDFQWFQIVPPANPLTPGNGGVFLPTGTLPFTFTIAGGSTALLEVTDLGLSGDRFDVLNGASSLGLTSSVPTGLDLGAPDDPSTAAGIANRNAAVVNPGISNGAYVLGAGSYSININVDPIGEIQHGRGSLRVSSVPEGSPGMLAFGISMLGLFAFAPRRSTKIS